MDRRTFIALSSALPVLGGATAAANGPRPESYGQPMDPPLASETIPALSEGARIRAGGVGKLAAPAAANGQAVLVDILDPWDRIVWTGATRGDAVYFNTRAWADGPYRVRFASGDELRFSVDTDFIEAARARAAVMMKEIEKTWGANGRARDDWNGASNLLQRVITEHCARKPGDHVSGDLHFGERTVGFRTETRTARLLGCGAADFMHGYEGPYRPMAREATSFFMPPDAVVDFAGRGAILLERWGYTPAAINHIVCSHPHRDHFQPWEIARFAAERAKATDAPLVVHGPPSVCDEMRAYAKDNHVAARIEVDTIPIGGETRAGEIEVKGLLARHGPPDDCLNYVLRWRGNSVFYGTDTGYPLPETIEALSEERFTVVLPEMTVTSTDDGATHMDTGDVRKLLGILRHAGAMDAYTRVISIHQSRGGIQSVHDWPHLEAAVGFESGYDGMPVPLAFRTPLEG